MNSPSDVAIKELLNNLYLTLVDTFQTLEALDDLVVQARNERLDQVATGTDTKIITRRIIAKAHEERWLDDLVETAYELRQADNRFADIYRQLEELPSDVIDLQSSPYLPSLPENYVKRQDFTILEQSLLTSRNERYFAIVGTSGTGKSVLAAALAQNSAVRSLFPGGVFWITRESNLSLIEGDTSPIPYQRQLLAQLDKESISEFFPTTWQEGLREIKRIVQQKLHDTRCLIVMDDPPSTVENILAALDVSIEITFLITTQDKTMLRAKGISERCIHELRHMQSDEALDLLSKWTLDTSDLHFLPEIALEVAKLVDFHPLALAMIGALVRGSLDPEMVWQDIRDALQEGSLAEVSHPVDSYGVSQLSHIFNKSFQVLDEVARERFLDLSIFRKGWTFDIQDLYKIWEFDKERWVRRYLRDWSDKSLIQSVDSQHFTIHSLVRLYMRSVVGSIGEIYQWITPIIYDDGGPLNLAVTWDDEEAVRGLLELGEAVDSMWRSGATALHGAAEQGSVDIVATLLHFGANVNRRFLDNFTPLCLASQNGHDLVVQLLLEAGADIDLQTKDGFSPFQIAVQYGHAEVVALLLKAGAYFDLQDDIGFSPLHSASERGHAAVVSFLLKAGASIDLQAERGFSPLRLAAQNGHADVVSLLLKAGASVDLQSDDGFSPFRIAAQHGHTAVVSLLLEAGASLTLQSKKGTTVIYSAVSHGHADIVQILITHGADCNWSMLGTYYAPLHIAAENENKEIVEILIKGGANIDQSDVDGVCALHIASEHWDLKTVDFLIGSGAMVDIHSKFGWTPLHFAASQSTHRKLLSVSARVSSSDDGSGLRTQSSIAMLFIDGGTIIKSLINGGATVDMQTNEGLAPLHMAAQTGDMNVVQALLNAGAKVDVRDHSGKSPLDYAIEKNHIEVENKLRAVSPMS